MGIASSAKTLATLFRVHKMPNGLIMTSFILFVRSILKRETSSELSESQWTNSEVYGTNRNETSREDWFPRNWSGSHHSWFVPVRYRLLQLPGFKRELPDLLNTILPDLLQLERASHFMGSST